MKFFFIALFFCSAVLAVNVRVTAVRAAEFEAWKSKHGKVYTTQEEHDQRLAIFSKALRLIEKHNGDSANTFSLGLNEFSDLSHEEFLAKMVGGGVKRARSSPTAPPAPTPSPSRANAPEIDWRLAAIGAVQPVQNQGQCGSSPDFAASAALEGAWVIAGNSPTAFSAQQLVSCSVEEGNDGCNGGFMTQDFQYVVKHGIETAQSYPYTSGSGNTGACNTTGPVAARFSGFKVVAANEVAVTDALQNGPLACAIDASDVLLQYYQSGVYSPKPGACSPTTPNHGIAIIGARNFPSLTGPPRSYLTLKNQWGASWGMNGYINVANTYDAKSTGTCAIATMCSFPIV